MNPFELQKELAQIVDPILGTVLDKHATARKLTVTIEVNSPQWGAQVLAMKQGLLDTLNAALPLPIIDLEVTLRRTRDVV